MSILRSRRSEWRSPGQNFGGEWGHGGAQGPSTARAHASSLRSGWQTRTHDDRFV